MKTASRVSAQIQTKSGGPKEKKKQSKISQDTNQYFFFIHSLALDGRKTTCNTSITAEFIFHSFHWCWLVMKTAGSFMLQFHPPSIFWPRCIFFLISYCFFSDLHHHSKVQLFYLWSSAEDHSLCNSNQLYSHYAALVFLFCYFQSHFASSQTDSP